MVNTTNKTADGSGSATASFGLGNSCLGARLHKPNSRTVQVIRCGHRQTYQATVSNYLLIIPLPVSAIPGWRNGEVLYMHWRRRIQGTLGVFFIASIDCSHHLGS